MVMNVVPSYNADMEYRYLGTTGVRISSLCFGTMSFGGDADFGESKGMFEDCLEAGINAFDCANVYQKGTSETILGELIKDMRDEVVITTKAYFPMGDGQNERGSSRLHLFKSVRDSLKRLGSDYVDIFFLHKFDHRSNLEETLRALEDIRRRGDILYIGFSNFAAWQVQKALGISALKQLSPAHCLQPMYNLVKRKAEVELLPMAEAEGLGVLSYSPVGGGLLSGKFTRDKRPVGSRLAENEMYKKRYRQPRFWKVAEDFSELAREAGVHPVTLAVAWVKDRPGITAPIIGARNREQLAASLAAAEYRIPGDLLVELDRISPPPPPATDRSEEQEGFGFEEMLK
jgi:aryl-alcohol dehydrogenase-like predicted oxidoreductase